jgi:hypothetical protein
MDPVTATLGAAASAATLAGLALRICTTLTTVVKTHKQSAALIYSLIGACKAIQVASNRIYTWVKAQSFARSGEEHSFYEQLEGSIEVGQIILGTLQQDLEPYTRLSPGQRSVSGTLGVLLNENILRDHCVRLNLQVSSLHLLLATGDLLVFYTVRMLVDLLTMGRPQPEARNLICDCLRPVFRKDEESAWTIIATGAGSSRASLSTSAWMDDRWESIFFDRPLACINDLLTAPVYKRLALSSLRPLRSSHSFQAVVPSTSAAPTANYHLLRDRSHAGSTQESCMTTIKRQSLARTTTHGMDTMGRDLVELAADAAPETSGVFSSSVVADLKLREPSVQYLPLQASIKRGHLAVEQQSLLDFQLLDATEKKMVFEMAVALDAGADINALKPGSYQTALQIATTTPFHCPAVRLLLRYKNVNVHVRDKQGSTLLRNAVRLQCKDCIQNLLDVGLSMTEGDESGISPFKYAAERCSSTEPLWVLLMHARNSGLDGSALTALDPDALHQTFSYTPFRRNHALVLVYFGWSITTPMKTNWLRSLTMLEDEALMMKMIRHRSSIEQIWAKNPIWDVVFQVAMRGPVPKIAILIQFLRSGIQYHHLETEIYDIARKKNNRALLEFFDRLHTHLRELEANETDMYQNDHQPLELDAVETSIEYKKSATLTEVGKTMEEVRLEKRAVVEMHSLRLQSQLGVLESATQEFSSYGPAPFRRSYCSV